ncbi:MAG: chemotaxis protein CheR [Cytophagales bacterium]|nr:chemotaxis protein CheR [Cytophagales bacterium]
MNDFPEHFFDTQMSREKFLKLSKFIYDNYGIKMPDNKQIMLEGRLHKRLKVNNIPTLDEYCDFVFSEKGQQIELIHMIDVVTTNKTDFFREPHHFDFLKKYLDTYTPPLLKIWSAGCSSGEEPYTLSMVLQEYKQTRPQFDFSILATDLSTRILKQAITAVYSEKTVEVIPLALKQKYLLKSKDRKNPTVRINKILRQKISFQRINFMDKEYAVVGDFDVVFCRNVLIYFDKQTQESVINKLCSKLKPNGFLFLGHSESISGLNVPLKQLEPTVYQKI